MKYHYSFCVMAMALSAMVMVLPMTALSQQDSLSPNYPPLGRLIDVGGHRLHINCTGKGSPTVVMESGAGDFSFDWGLVQPEVARFTRVCTYDRAGYAWSEPGPTPRTMQQIVYELHTGLDKAGVKGPYVLVGHSFGGLIVRVYASQFPKEITGMVLVDSSHENQLVGITDRETKQDKLVRWRTLSRGREIPPFQSSMPASAGSNNSLGVRSSSTSSTKVEAPFDKLPLNLQAIRVWAKSQPRFNPARFSEFDFLPDELARMHAEGRKLGDIPLVVLTRGGNENSGADEQAKKQMSEEYEQRKTVLEALSSNSKLMVAKGSSHHIQLDAPKLVIDSIHQVVNASRRHKKLRPSP